MSRKEEVLVVVLKVIFLFDVLGPLEQEDEAVDVWLDASDDLVVLKRVDLLDLNAGGSHLFDEFGKDSRVRLNSAPLIEHQFYI